MDAGITLGLLVGFGTVLALVVRAWRQAWVPAWAAVAGPLLWLMVVRRSFADLTPDATAIELAAAVAAAAPCGLWLAAMGGLAVVGGLVARMRGQGSPALVGVGSVCVAAGVVWWGWASGEAALWQAALHPQQVPDVHGAAVAQLEVVAMAGVWILLLGALPSAVWGFVRERWIGLGESVAAGVLVLLVLHTGKPARDAVNLAYAGWLGSCAPMVRTDVSYGRHPVVQHQACAPSTGHNP